MSLRVEWKEPHTRRIILSYIPDWVVILVMFGAFCGIDQITPFRREFSLADKTIMHSHAASDSVSMAVVVVVCLVAPSVIIALVSLGIKRSILDFHHGILGLCLSLSMTMMLTTVIKVTVGRPRPDFISRCQPPDDAVDPPFGYSNYTICTADINSDDMIDGFKSFPSGHSSSSFGGLAYLALYLAGKMRMFDERGRTYKGFLFSFPFIGALLVAISRTQDYRHHWQDVLIGSLLGLATAWFSYRQYYPSLLHAHCWNPYRGRIDMFKLNQEINVNMSQRSGHDHQIPLGGDPVADDESYAVQTGRTKQISDEEKGHAVSSRQ